MSRLFILTLTLIVLIALASAGWLTLGAIAGDYDPVPQHPWASKSMSGRRVYHRDTSKAESNDLFTIASEEDHEQAAFDAFGPSAEYESNEFAEAVPFTPNEQAENPFADDPPAGQEALRAEPFEAPRDSKRKPSSTGLLRIRSDEAPDLDQPTRNALKEMIIQIEREADELQQLGRLKEAEHRRHVSRRLQALMEGRRNLAHSRSRTDRGRNRLRVIEIDKEPLTDSTALADNLRSKYFDLRSKIDKILPKIEPLRRAADNLREGGLNEQANELSQLADKLHAEVNVLLKERNELLRLWRKEHSEAELAKNRQKRKHAGHAPRDNVHEALNDLRHEIRNLRNEVREMHELLEQHVKRRGKSKVELIPRNIEIEVEEELRPFDKRDIKKRDSERIEIEEIDIQAPREEEIEEEHEERPLPTPDYDLPPINQPEQTEEEDEVLPSEENNVEAY